VLIMPAAGPDIIFSHHSHKPSIKPHLSLRAKRSNLSPPPRLPRHSVPRNDSKHSPLPNWTSPLPSSYN
jgi:hypothetical protein